MIKNILLCLFAGSVLFGTYGSLIAETILDKETVRARLTQHNFIKGNFGQERTLKGIDRPIKSSGSFVIWRNNGIYWETNKPLFQATSLSKDGAYYWTDSDTAELMQDGVFKINERISKLMLAFFTADFEQLEKDFVATWNIEDNYWSVKLVPSGLYIGKAIKQVELVGSVHIDSVFLELATGDITKVWLAVTAEGNEPDTDSKSRIHPDISAK